MTEIERENQLQSKGLTKGRRATPDSIEASIQSEYYHRVPDTTMTLCVLTINGGYLVTGESASVEIDNFDEQIGREIARQNAKQKIWALEGYRLCNES